MPCKHVLNSTVSIRAPCCLKWFECFECHDEFMDHPMSTSPVLTLACLCCRMLFKKDLALFGDQDEVCPHCEQRWIKPGETNEGFLFGMFQEEFDRSIAFGCERSRGIKSTSELDKIGHINDDEESLQEDEESGNKRQEMEERRKKMMRLKGKKKGKKSPSKEQHEEKEEEQKEQEQEQEQDNPINSDPVVS
ncbi:hypothetical protein TL16_g04125 [Triparma laevis f. inornata]|uniref:CHY-type domain-containing protein n=1 Tax=Triparma laevis f. inornata TaxID=1714386 RepID=A0A9W7AC82_9STRA|nr:hypothetical protein TL16_g04125 [Triparma laevis f. inornata]